METIQKAKDLLKDLSNSGKIDTDSLSKIAGSLDEIDKSVGEVESQNKELRDKLTDMILKNPNPKVEINQSETETPKEKTLEECIEEQLNKE